MASPQLSLRRRAPVKPPPPGVRLATELPRSEPLALDEIVSRTREGSVRCERRWDESLEKREAGLAKAEAALGQREHDLRTREASVLEREREAHERIKLAEVREEQAAQREALLEASRDELTSAHALQRLQRDLELSRARVRELEKAAARQQEEMEALECALAEARSARPVAVEDAVPAEQTELSDLDALIAEREAFIEESENTLFHRAQELQELEMHLEQWQEELTARAKALGLNETAPAALAEAADEAPELVPASSEAPVSSGSARS